MKKWIALLLVLCLALACASVLAEEITSDGTPVRRDGFTANFAPGEIYTIYEDSEQNSATMTVLPFAAEGDKGINYNLSRRQEESVVEKKCETIRDNLETMQKQIIAGQTDKGRKVKNFNMAGVVDKTLFGKAYPALVFDITVGIGTDTITLYERQYYLADKGYVLTISAFSEKDLDRTCRQMEADLAWDE